MGGYGSGRHRRSFRTKVEDCRELDITMFDFDEIPDDGARWSGTATWTRDGEEVASVGTLITTKRDGDDVLRLSYTITDTATDDETEISYRVPIEYTEPHFGGRRPWFRCPGRGCGDRVRKIYKPPRRDKFLCRDCHDLTYESQRRSGDFFYENIGKPFDRLDEAKEAVDEEFSRENLREYHAALKETNEGLCALNQRTAFGEVSDGVLDDGRNPRVSRVPPFEEWVEKLFQDACGRGYGYYGRCTATAKTTGERCRQPATGEHGKCYYHGGATG